MYPQGLAQRFSSVFSSVFSSSASGVAVVNECVRISVSVERTDKTNGDRIADGERYHSGLLFLLSSLSAGLAGDNLGAVVLNTQW